MPREGVPMPWNRTPCPGSGPHAVAGHCANPSAPRLTWHAGLWHGMAWDTHSRTQGGLIQPSAWPCPAPTPLHTSGVSTRGLGGCGFSWERLQAGARPSPGALKAGPGELLPFPRQDLGPSRLAPAAPSPPGHAGGSPGLAVPGSALQPPGTASSSDHGSGPGGDSRQPARP